MSWPRLAGCIAPMMALPIPVLGCVARLRLVILVSFPNRSDAAELGVFQVAPSCAVGFHFRPRTGFAAHFLYGRPADGAGLPAPASPVMKHRCVAESDHVAGQTSKLKRCGRRTGMCPEGSTWEGAPAGALLWLFASSEN